MDNNTASAFDAAGAPSPQFAILTYFFPGLSIFSSVLHAYLGTDVNFYVTGVLLALGAVVAWTYVSQHLWGLIDSHLMSNVKIRTDDEIYNMFMTWISRQKFSQNSRRFIANTDVNSRSSYMWRYWNDSDDEDEEEDDDDADRDDDGDSMNFGRQKRALHYTPAFGSHFFWFKGRPLLFERIQNREQVGFSSMADREELSVSCFGRNPRILKELLLETRKEHMKKDEKKTVIYRGTSGGGGDPSWQRCMSRLNRPFSTVILDGKTKQDLIDDATDYLNPATRRWYANRGIPYRRGYLLHGPPGTGKSSLSLAMAGFFRMKIYIISLSSPTANEEALTSLFADLPTRCVVLLEDIDSAGLTHTRDDADAPDTPVTEETASPPPEPLKKGGSQEATITLPGRLSLSGLLNILDGVASQEGRILIMTTNHIERLDAALIRPGRVDMIIPFGLADREMTASIFRAIYAPYDDEVLPVGHTVAAKREVKEVIEEDTEKKKTKKKAEINERVGALAAQFAAKIPEMEFSPAQIQGLLLRFKHDPEAAIKYSGEWVEATRKDKKDNEEKERIKEERRQQEEEEAKAEEAKENRVNGSTLQVQSESEDKTQETEEEIASEDLAEQKEEEEASSESPKKKESAKSDSGYGTPSG